MRSSRTSWRAIPLNAIALAMAVACAKAPPKTTPAQAPDPVRQLQSDIDALLDGPGHQHGVWGVLVHSLARDDRLYARNPDTLLVPASAMKLVSVAAAAETVGWSYAFETRMLATGPVVNGVLEGDIVISGSGDPSVFGRAANDAVDPWVETLRTREITRVAGRIIGDDDALEEPQPGFGWTWDDLGYTYGAIPGALNLAENRVDVVVVPAAQEGLPATIELPPNARDLPIVNQVVTGPAGVTDVRPQYRPGDTVLTMVGTIGVGEKPATIAVSPGNPTEWFARSVRNRLLAAGIDVAGRALDVDDLPAKPDWRTATVLYTHRSPTLADIAKPLLKDSINLYAEAVLRLAASPSANGNAPSMAAGLDGVRARLQSWGIPAEGIQLVDGSGLSRRNVIAPSTLVALLRRFYDPQGTSPFMQALAVAGRDGTLASRMKGTPAEANAIGKTGSMSNVRTLAGFVSTADGEPIAFAVMANNFEGPASGATATIDRVVVRLASFSRSPRR